MANRNEQLFERAKKIIPGGVNSPVRAFGSVGGVPPGPVHAAARQRHPPHTRRWNSGGHHLP